MEEKKERTFEDIKTEVQLNSEVTEEQERIIADTARREIELERAKNK